MDLIPFGVRHVLDRGDGLWLQPCRCLLRSFLIVSCGEGMVPTWKRGGYEFRMYLNHHPPLHVHVYQDGKQLDRYAFASGTFLDGTIGKHRGRVLAALHELMSDMIDDEGGE